MRTHDSRNLEGRRLNKLGVSGKRLQATRQLASAIKGCAVRQEIVNRQNLRRPS
jgi:hypothetical protein